jgi:hypothetical protein
MLLFFAIAIATTIAIIGLDVAALVFVIQALGRTNAQKKKIPALLLSLAAFAAHLDIAIRNARYPLLVSSVTVPSVLTVVAIIASIPGFDITRRRFRWALVTAVLATTAVALMGTGWAGGAWEKGASSTVGHIADIAIGRYQACLRTDAGDVLCGPIDHEGGDATTMKGINQASAIVVGNEMSCALAHEDVLCWGAIGGLLGSPDAMNDARPTIMPWAHGALGLEAHDGLLAVRLPHALALRNTAFRESGDIELADDVVEVTAEPTFFCVRTEDGHARCTGLKTSDKTLRVAGAEMRIPIDDPKRLTSTRTAVCVERSHTVECFDAWKGLRTPDAIDGPLLVLQGNHPVIFGEDLCVIRDNQIVCARIEKEASLKSFTMPLTPLALYGGSAGACARLPTKTLQCVLDDRAQLSWLGRFSTR